MGQSFVGVVKKGTISLSESRTNESVLPNVEIV
jgi:hypothetical protein